MFDSDTVWCLSYLQTPGVYMVYHDQQTNMAQYTNHKESTNEYHSFIFIVRRAKYKYGEYNPIYLIVIGQLFNGFQGLFFPRMT